MWSHTCPTSSASCQNTRGRTRSHSSQPPMAAASAADRMFLIYTEINTHISHNCSNILTIHGAQLHSAVSFTLTLHLKLEYWNIHIFCEISITKLPLHFDSLKKKIQSSKWAPLFRFDSTSIHFCWHPESSKHGGRVLAEARLPLWVRVAPLQYYWPVCC